MRGVIDDIHLLVHEDMCTTVEVEEIRTILSNQQTEMSAISTTLSDQKTQISAISATLNNQKTDISTIKDQMNKMMSMLQKLEKSACCTTTVVPTATCSVSAAGIEDSSIIEDGQLTSSSGYPYSLYAPRYARLHSTTGWGWLMIVPYKVGEWLQVDLENNRRIFGVATQGTRDNPCCYTKTYKLQYKKEGQQSFETYKDDGGNVKIFNGNVDNDSVVKNNFDEAFTARYIRIFPESWKGNPALRWELYIC